eukprot:TRINITY_DN1852_c0_g1_i1.p1 TRINITY_DN1852_c0_g1~~TRINITY_DN1852_c0_g1_i1.p1  ORF type:complete len:670 (-),score=111.56 TRINITY_DN1852_c0_g1_i1:530-2518(-)
MTKPLGFLLLLCFVGSVIAAEVCPHITTEQLSIVAKYSAVVPWDLGDFNGCMATPKFMYCLGTLYVKNALAGQPDLPITEAGLCLPEDCNMTSANAYFQWFMVNHSIVVDPKMANLQCYDKGIYKHGPLDGAGTFIVVLAGFFASCLLIGSGLDLFFRQRQEYALLPTSAGGVPDSARAGPGPVPKWCQFFIAFSARSNLEKLLVPHRAQNPAATACLNGVRAFSMFWIVSGHVLELQYQAGWTNMIEATSGYILTADFATTYAAVAAVDTFFWLTGFLVGYNLLKTMQRSRRTLTKPAFWGQYYFARIYRLSPVYYFVLVLYWKVLPHLTQGPLWPRLVDGIIPVCDDYWWTNILYINNFHPFLMANECMQWAWYLANDFQFYSIVPLMIWFYFRDRSQGVLAALVGALLSLVGSFVGTYVDIENGYVSRYLGTGATTYVKPYCRSFPFFMGLLVAYFIYWVVPTTAEDMSVNMSPKADKAFVENLEKWRSIFIPEESAQYRFRESLNSIYVRAVLYVFSAALMITCCLLQWWIIRDYQLNHAIWGTMALCFSNLYMRLSWGVGISIIFSMYILGYGGTVRGLLGSEVWVVPARLTYGTYLCHPALLIMYFFSQDTLGEITKFSYMMHFFGFLGISFLVSLGLWLLVEKPFQNLEKFFGIR